MRLSVLNLLTHRCCRVFLFSSKFGLKLKKRRCVKISSNSSLVLFVRLSVCLLVWLFPYLSKTSLLRTVCLSWITINIDAFNQWSFIGSYLIISYFLSFNTARNFWTCCMSKKSCPIIYGYNSLKTGMFMGMFDTKYIILSASEITANLNCNCVYLQLGNIWNAL